jgi:hypothetical protein
MKPKTNEEIIGISLAELVFLLFLVVSLFSFLKIQEISEELDKKESIVTELQSTIAELQKKETYVNEILDNATKISNDVDNLRNQLTESRDILLSANNELSKTIVQANQELTNLEITSIKLDEFNTNLVDLSKLRETLILLSSEIQERPKSEPENLDKLNSKIESLLLENLQNLQNLNAEKIKSEELSKELSAIKLLNRQMLDNASRKSEALDDYEYKIESLKTALDIALDQIALKDSQLRNLMQRNGFDYPPCFLDKDDKAEYLFRVIIYENEIKFLPIWPQYRLPKIQEIPEVLSLANKSLNRNQIKNYGVPILAWSNANTCRHYVKIEDKAATKDGYKLSRQTVEGFFYKYEIRDE